MGKYLVKERLERNLEGISAYAGKKSMVVQFGAITVRGLLTLQKSGTKVPLNQQSIAPNGLRHT